MRLSGLIAIFALISSIPAAFGAYVEPTSQEQALYDKLRTEFGKLSISKKDVADTLSSFSTPITIYFPCDQGETYISVNATVQTKLAKFDSSIAHSGGAITGGIYVWKCSITVSGGKMAVNCNNELMLNAAALAQSTEKDPAIKQIEDLVVFYHELLHGQLMIDAIKSSESWHDYTCKTSIQQDLDYSYTDADHQIITPLQTEFAKKLIEDEGGFFKVEQIPPDQTSSGSFSKKVGSLYDYPEYVKSGINISARSYNVADIKITSQKNDIIISGTLNDKSKTGIIWLYVFGKEVTSPTTDTPTKSVIPTPQQISIPDWVKDLAKWWSDGTISDKEFVTGIKYLIENDIISIPQTAQGQAKSEQIPYWIKKNAKWWSQGAISDSDFVAGLQYLIQNRIMSVQTEFKSDTPTLSSEPPDDFQDDVQKMGNVQISVPTFTKQSYKTIQAQITGKIDDFKTGTYVILSITKPDGSSYDLKGILTNKGQFTVPIMIDSNWQVGKYQIIAKYNNLLVDSDSFSVQ
ncbi:MAG: hypothetical protein ACT4OD_03685 [Candidatus Nitrosotenuis sp.]